MSDFPSDPAPTEQDRIAALVQAAGRRAMPDAARMERARQNVHEKWRTEIRRRRNLRWRFLAAAALALGVIGAWLAQQSRPLPVSTVAAASRVTGTVLVHEAAAVGSQVRLIAGRDLRTNDVIETQAGGRAGIRWFRNAELRVDADSLVRLESASDVRLLRGAVYVETLADPAEINVHTPTGYVSHVGTRFEVRVSSGRTQVRVRDGAALFSDAAHPPVRIDAGQQLLASGGATTVEAGPPAFDSAWDWTRSIAPVIEIEGRFLFDVLEALSKESGMQIRYVSADVRQRARKTILHGSIEGLDVRSALPVVLAGSDLAFETYPDRVEIFEAELR